MDVRGWQGMVPCRDVLGRDKFIALTVSVASGVVLQVPPGESATLTGSQAGELSEMLLAAGHQLPEELFRSATVSANLSAARVRAGWIVACNVCGTALSPVARYTIAVSNGLWHLRSVHNEVKPDDSPEVDR
jgi:hypothetical protein